MSDIYSKQLTAVEAMIAGFEAGMPGGGTTFLLASKSYTQPDMLAMLAGIQGILAAVPATDSRAPDGAARAHRRGGRHRQDPRRSRDGPARRAG